jgi:hypothetical protein
VVTPTESVNGGGAYRKGEYYQSGLSFNNANTAVACVLTNAATLGASSATTVRTSLLTANNPTFTYDQVRPGTTRYDQDRNLTQDGPWKYKWGSENCLIQMTSVTTLEPMCDGSEPRALARARWDRLADLEALDMAMSLQTLPEIHFLTTTVLDTLLE